MNRRIDMFLVAVMILMLCSCGKPENEELYEGTCTLTEVVAGKSEKITERYAIDDEALKINAEVEIPMVEIKQGELAEKAFNAERFSDIICPDVNLQKSDDSSDSTVYTGGDDYADLNYNKRVEVWKNSGNRRYDDYQLDDYFRGNYIEKRKDEMSNDEKEFVDQMSNQTQDILNQLGIQVQIMAEKLYEDNDKRYCWVFSDTLLDAHRLVDANEGEFFRCNVAIADKGINSIEIEGLYEIDNEENVKIISLEQMLAIVKKGVSERNINVYEEPVTNIALVYMLKEISGKIQFFPVWCLSGAIFEEYEKPFICIDARNGALVYMR